MLVDFDACYREYGRFGRHSTDGCECLYARNVVRAGVEPGSRLLISEE